MFGLFFLVTFSAIILEGEPKSSVVAEKPGIISKASILKNETPKLKNLYKGKVDKDLNIAVTVLKRAPRPPSDIKGKISGWSKDLDFNDLKEGGPNPAWVK